MRIIVLAALAASVTLAAPFAVPGQAAPGTAPGLVQIPICTARAAAPDWAALGLLPAADQAVSPADQAGFLFRLGLLQGHLVIGRALIDAGQPTLALPHFGHPVRELYDDLRPELARRGLSPFDADLVSLEALAATPADPALSAHFDKVLRTLDAERATVPSELRDNERFTLGVLAAIADAAASDYAESVENGTVAKPVEYHDGRGYLMFADAELKRLEARPDLKSSARLKAARARFADMQAVVAPLLPPARPIRTPAQLKALSTQFRQAVSATRA